MGRSWLSVALESNADGVLRKEKELVFYAKLVAPEELKTADKMIHQEQWNAKIPKSEENAGSGQLRIRKEWQHGEQPAYIFTTKAKARDGHNLEHEVETTEDHFKLMQVLANKGMIKTRYEFAIKGTSMKWEIDTFNERDGSLCQWVKLDLEVPPDTDLDAFEVPAFPIRLSDVLTEGDKEYDPRVGEKISELYERYFLTDNIHNTAKMALQKDVISAVHNPAAAEPLAST